MPAVKVNGVNLNYEIHGEGPPLVLIHGFQSSVFVWNSIVKTLSKSFQAITLELRGHGDSDKPEGPYRIQDFSDDLLGFLDALGLDKVDLMGQSMGGRTSTLFAIEHSDRLNRVMLVSSSAGPPSGAYQKRFQKLLETATNEGMAAVFNHELMSASRPPGLREGPMLEEYRRRFLKNTPETYAATANALFTMPDLTGRLGEISVPAWVCYGSDDAGPLVFSEIYKERILDCTLSIIPGSGHFPMWDNTEKFLAALDGFLAKVPAS